MAKLPRVQAKIFASKAAETDIGQFGSALTGTKVNTGDIAEIQALPAYEEGWRSAVISNRNYPTLQEMNGVQKTFSQHIAYFYENGIPEWDANTTYYANTSFCQVNGVWYQSVTDNNIGNNPAEDQTETNWKKVELGGGSGQGGFNLFDLIKSDHIYEGDEAKGKALLGTYVYKTGVAGTRDGYPDFYNRCLEEYNNYNQLSSIKDYVTLVGSPSLKNGILSGFNSTSWAVLPQNFSPNTSDWKMFFKFTTGTIGTNQDIINSSSVAYQPLSISITSEGKLYVASWIDNTESKRFEITGTTVLSANTTYYLSLEYNSTNGYTLKLGTNKNNMTTEGTSTVTSAVNSGNNLALGADFAENGAYYGAAFTGSIDLKECYINIANKLWWKGSTLLYINSNSHKFYNIADKAIIDEIYESTGIGYFFGVDEDNERIFLPRGHQFLAFGNTNALKTKVFGTGMSLGLSNNSGLANKPNTTEYPNGLVYNSAAYGQKAGTGWSGNPSGGSQIYLGVTTDATKSGLTGSTDLSSNGVEAYVYMVVGNTEQQSAITDVVDVTASENDTLPLFTPWYFDYKPNNISFLKAGQQVNSGGIYTFAYNELVNELTNPKYDLKVIEAKDKVAGVDYSKYWTVEQDTMTFTTPTKISYKALNGGIKGNGLTLGLTNGTNNGGLSGYSNGSTNAAISYTANYGKPVGQTTTGASQVGSLGVTLDPTKSGIIAEGSTAQLYFKVANAVQNLELMDAGAITEALADKIGRRDCKAYITETYKNGTSWYRIYSDGWCEQGGKSRGAANTTGARVNFLKAYPDTEYKLITMFNGESTKLENAAPLVAVPFKLTPSGFNASTMYGGSGYAFAAYQFSWEAKGYLAEGEY